MISDANLDSLKWNDTNYRHYKVATDMKNALEQNGMISLEIGNTFMADRRREDGSLIESALDHVNIQQIMAASTKVEKGRMGATDHVPIIATIEVPKIVHAKPKKIYKRCWTDFSTTKWKTCVASQRWEEIGKTENVHDMVKSFNNNIQKALDKCAPYKHITIRSGYKNGISDKTKSMIKERDKARLEIKNSKTEKHIALQKYRTIRNRVTAAIRRDTIMHNDKRVREAENESEVWKIVKESTAPNKETAWKLKEGENVVEDESEIADIFHNHFISKIASLKEGIDKEYIKEPLKKLKQKMTGRNLKFELKQVSEKVVKKAIKEMNK